MWKTVNFSQAREVCRFLWLSRETLVVSERAQRGNKELLRKVLSDIPIRHDKHDVISWNIEESHPKTIIPNPNLLEANQVRLEWQLERALSENACPSHNHMLFRGNEGNVVAEAATLLSLVYVNMQTGNQRKSRCTYLCALTIYTDTWSHADLLAKPSRRLCLFQVVDSL